MTTHLEQVSALGIIFTAREGERWREKKSKGGKWRERGGGGGEKHSTYSEIMVNGVFFLSCVHANKILPPVSKLNICWWKLPCSCSYGPAPPNTKAREGLMNEHTSVCPFGMYITS